MKRITAIMVLWTMLYNVVFAGFAFAADDIYVDNRNNNENRNDNRNEANATSDANASSDQEQNQQQKQAQDAHSSAIVTSPRELLGLPVAPNLMGVTVVPESKGCIPISSQIFTQAEIVNMKAGSFWEKKGGWFHGMFTSRIKKSVRVPYDGKEHHGEAIVSLDWNPLNGFVLHPGDRKLGTFNCEGDYGYPLDASLGMCLAEAFEYTNMKQVYACYTVRYDAHSSGLAYSGAGGASGITGSDGNVGVSGAVAGTFGTSVAYANKAFDVELYAVEVATRQVEAVRPLPPVVEESEPPCDTDEIHHRIRDLKQEVQKCTRFCLNNLNLRHELGNAYIELYVCTGQKSYLREAIKHYEIAERNYIHGWDIKSHKAEADAIIAQVYYNQGGCIWVLNGKKAALRFKVAKKLERIPSGFAR